jgi:hypothetical protein
MHPHAREGEYSRDKGTMVVEEKGLLLYVGGTA